MEKLHKILQLFFSGVKISVKDFIKFIHNFLSYNPHLLHLDLSETAVTKKQILQISTGASKSPENGGNVLETIDLTGCYSAPRGWRREISRNEFERFRYVLEQVLNG